MSIDWWRLWPKYWLQNYPTDHLWDRILNDLMDRYEIEVVDEHTAKIGPAKVWIANYPYSFGSVRAPRRSEKLPKVGTRRKLKAKIGAQQRRNAQDPFLALLKEFDQ